MVPGEVLPDVRAGEERRDEWRDERRDERRREEKRKGEERRKITG